MAVLAFGLAGSAIGASIGGTFLGMSAAALGWSIGSAVGSALFAPEQHTEGPRLDDLSVQASTYGKGITLLYGKHRMPGNVIWSSGLREVATTEEHGKKGKDGPTSTTYTYFANFAVSFGYAPIGTPRLLRVWADNDIIFDVRDLTVQENGTELVFGDPGFFEAVARMLLNLNATANNLDQAGASIDFLDGTQTTAHPVIEAHKGVGNTPAYMDQMLIVFENLELTNYGNRIPNIRAEIAAAATGQVKYLDQLAVWNNADFGGGTWTLGGFLWHRGIFYVARADTSGTTTTFRVYKRYPNGTVRRILNRTETGLVSGIDLGTANARGGTQFVFAHSYSGVVWRCFLFDIASETFTTKGWVKAETFLDAGGAGAKLAVDGAIFKFNSLDDDLRRIAYYHGDRQDALDEHSANPGADTSALVSSGTVEGVTATADHVYYTTVSGAVATLHKVDADGIELETWDVSYVLTYDANPVGADALRAVDEQDGIALFFDAAGVSFQDRHTILADLDLGTFTKFDGPYDSSGVKYNLNPYGYLRHGLMYSGDSATVYTHAANVAHADPAALSGVVGDLCDRSGLGDYDASALADSVRGYVIARATTGRTALEQLASAYFFDAVESDWQYKFVPRGGASVATLDAEVLGAYAEGDEPGDQVESIRRHELELPRTLSLTYPSVNSNYQPNEQHASREITESLVTAKVDLPIVMTDDQARQVVDVNLWNNWQQRTRRTSQLPLEHIGLDPTDVVTLQAPHFTGLVRITDAAFGDNGVIEIAAVDEDDATYLSTSVGASAGDQDATVATNWLITEALFMDLPALRSADDDAGIYLAASGISDAWPGCSVLRSTDAGLTWATVAAVNSPSKIGDCLTILGDGPVTIWDEGSTLKVRLINADAILDTAASDTTVLGGANWAAVGPEGGPFEIIAFKNVVQNADGTFTLSRLLRGLRGTEHLAAGHVADERFVLLENSKAVRIEFETAQIGSTYTYAIATFGTLVSAATETEITPAGNALEPFSPAHVAAARDGSGNITFSCVRRDRLDGSWRDYVDVPLSEASESYEWDVMNGAAVVRTLASSSPSASYTAAQQTTDFGAPQSSVEVNVYQLSATVGRGVPANATV